MTLGPQDQEQRRQRRNARREVAKRHHPDVGGDPDRYQELMAGLDRELAADVGGLKVTPSRRVRRMTALGRRRLRRRVRAVRARLPRRLPGSRRYVDL